MADSDPLYLLRQAFKLFLVSIQVGLLIWFCWTAYEIRLYPIKDFGMIIHEFDPWFNYRATEYLAEHGLSKFNKWYDYESWYPLGRPIGTTIYPGMQITAVVIWDLHKMIGSLTIGIPTVLTGLGQAITGFWSLWGLQFLPPVPSTLVFEPMSVNDICCMIPCWFGVSAAVFAGLMAYEVSRSAFSAVVTCGIMAIIPAGLMRSVGGEFDNEAVAMTVICMTFWLWMRSVRNPESWMWGVLTGFSYVYMVAAWGGYIFVLNMIGVHALMLVGLGRFNSGVYKAYSLFFVIGTAGAMQIPVVGWTPLRSLEQLGPLLVFLGFQVLQVCDVVRRNRKMEAQEFVTFRIRVVAGFLVGLVILGVLLIPSGFFGPLSARIRGLFVKHTKTGNPLVDSVAEHQPASASMYSAYLNLPLDYSYLGILVCLWNRNNAVYFLLLYGFIAEHFSGKMSRLVLICAPICSVAAGCWCGFLIDRILDPFFLLLGRKPWTRGSSSEAVEDKSEPTPEPKSDKANGKAKAKGKSKEVSSSKEIKKKKRGGSRSSREVALKEWEEEERPGGMMQIKRQLKGAMWSTFTEENIDDWEKKHEDMDNDASMVSIRAVVSLVIVFFMAFLSGTPRQVSTFIAHCDQIAQSLSNPQVAYMVKQRDGSQLLIDDYLKGYQWIDANTPKDSRVIAWWDYGYQITGIAKRTSIADGNTWNHEHIATLGRTLTSPEKRAWNAIRHWADYVLVWAGGGGDDLAKSPHLARIGNSVFPDHCGDDDPKCHKFSFYSDNSPTPMMARSLLYNLVQHGQKAGVKVDKRYFQEVHTTKYGLMRVFKVMNVSEESKEWCADPANRICDAPGSWYCVGQYPPALQPLIAKRQNFAQVEDFNKAGEKSAYTKMIDREMSGKKEL